MYCDTLWSVCDDIITNINLQINASKKDTEKLKTAITEMEKQKEAIRLKFSGEVFPSIKRKLREEIPAVLGDNITAMIETVKEQFEVQIKNQEEAINAQMANEKTSIKEKESAQQKLETIRSDVQTITSEIIAWGK